ncbi:ribokinase [Curvibacter sp. APW13]|uniref:ribokinase n=1 Tax=Curvibacter sp. APW13 TaxID=3077236 RepID=UPI0028DEEB83|nr:ribokinase [Curvibacter sp. APW13]MDT8991653.1 ribokinase [Curvibacter sp. APW13]
MSTKILVAGSANLDFVVQAPHIPAPGETVLGTSYRNFPGGKGANQAVACARAGGVSTAFLGAFGEDGLALPIMSSLRDAGVELHQVVSPSEPTGTAFICVAANGENAITVVPGANKDLQPCHLPALDGIAYLLMQLETPLPTVLAFAAKARQAGVRVVLNAAPAQPQARTVLHDVDVLVVNEGELLQLSPTRGTIASMMQSLRVATVVTTLGSKGCVALSAQGFLVQPAFPVEAVDTTAAGDTFCGTFVAALAHNCSLADALHLASLAGALACTRPGAQNSIPSRTEVLALMASAPSATSEQVTTLERYCGL